MNSLQLIGIDLNLVAVGSNKINSLSRKIKKGGYCLPPFLILSFLISLLYSPCIAAIKQVIQGFDFWLFFLTSSIWVSIN